VELTEQDVSWAKETIKKIGLFDSCSDQELAHLLDGLEKTHFNANATILFQGEISSKLHLVETGTVAVIVRRGQEKAKVATLGINGFFGEISLLTPRAATATIKAESDVDIVALPGEVVQALVRKNPVLAGVINTRIAERLEAQKHPDEKSK
jgi:CRP-like cAMP-binding protein